MSKFIPQAATFREQRNQNVRRFNLEKRQEEGLKPIRAQFDSEPMETLKTATPDSLQAFQAARGLGLTEGHTLMLLGRWYMERIQADARAAAEAKKAGLKMEKPTDVAAFLASVDNSPAKE